MLILNDSEKTILNKKLDALDTFSDAFMNYNLRFDTLVQILSAKELSSAEFLNRFECTIKKVCPDERYYKLVIDLASKNFTPGENETYKDYLDPILNRVDLDFVDPIYDSGYYIRSHLDSMSSAVLRLLKRNSATAEDAVEYIFNNKAAQIAESKGCGINKLDYLSDIISSLKITNADNFITIIQKFDPDCKILPLLITNASITKDKKVSILKLGYRQKDFPKYKEYFKDNLSSFEDLDTFLEATIFQNNRVKEKEDNLVKMFKDFFIDGQSSGCKMISLSEPLPWADEFREKYRHYILSESFIKKLYNTAVNLSTNTWRRESQYKNFLLFMLKDLAVEEKLQKIGSSKYYGVLAENLPDLLKEAEKNNNIDHIKLLLEAAITLSGANKDGNIYNLYSKLIKYNEKGKETFTAFLNKYASNEVLESVLGSMFVIKFKYNPSQSCNNIQLSQDLTRGDGWMYEALIEKFADESFVKIPFIEASDAVYFGLPFEKLMGSFKGNYSSLPIGMKTLIENISEFYKKLIIRFKKSGDSVKKYIADRFFKCFEDEGGVSNLTSSLISISTTKELQKCYSGWYATGSNTEDSLEKFYKSIIEPTLNEIPNIYNEMMVLYPNEYTENGLNQINENFSQLKETVSLIGAVNI